MGSISILVGELLCFKSDAAVTGSQQKEGGNGVMREILRRLKTSCAAAFSISQNGTKGKTSLARVARARVVQS